MSDGNEATRPVTADVWAEHSVWPGDPGFSRAIAGGVTTLQILPGSANLIGGSVIDFPDTAIDAILTGVGGLGIFATFKGLAHAQEQYKKGGEMAEAYLEGAGVAITETAKALVDTSEMAYKVVMSRPSRFIGRGVAKGLIKLDKKIFGE